MTPGDTLYIYIGGAGRVVNGSAATGSMDTGGGFNGGGGASGGAAVGQTIFGGGGATDNGFAQPAADRRGNGGSGIVLIAYPS